jgi:hypothetical protein
MNQHRQEECLEQVAMVELSIEKSRARAERAAEALKGLDAEDHLIDALERVQQELTSATRLLRQGTYFAVPSAQEEIKAA